MNGQLRTVLAFAALMSIACSASAATLPKKPIHTNKSRFRIPFNSDTAALQRMNAQEIQLHVSRDSGATWQFAQSLPPNGGKFEYQGPGDGEYWFAVKTLDGRNQLHPPAGKYETGLIVVIDTSAPTLELSAHQTAPGKIQMSWRANDANLDVATFKAEYLSAGSHDWLAVPVSAQGSGDTAWTVGTAGVVAVRGSVADMAGNTVQAKTQVHADAGAERERDRPMRPGPVAETPTGEETTSVKQQSQSTVQIQERSAADREYLGPVITPQRGLPQYPQIKDRLVSNSRSELSQENWAAVPVNNPQQLSIVSLDSSRSIQTPQRFASIQKPTVTLPSPQQQQQRPNSRHRSVATRQFQIGYEVENVGPSGLSNVELFITEDNGRMWWKYADDPDQKSPFDVEVRRDGIYGFAIRVRSGAGLSIDPPIPGEPPAIVVAVDQTLPVVELLPVQQGRGVYANRLLLRWKLIDEFPAEKPVSMQYAPNPGGPWEEVFGWKENANGEFVWTISSNLPSQIYLRVCVRDAAGNTAQAESQLPLIIDLQRPAARIVDVESVLGTLPQ